jgi:formamidopyrimidine-DNA glycosylase
MPELPEVETTLRGISKEILNKKNKIICLSRAKT